MSKTSIPAAARESYEALAAELERRGVHEHELVVRGKHLAIVFEWEGEQKTQFFASTPSDRRQVKNELRDLRHLLGVVGGPKKVGERRQKKHRAPSAPKVPKVTKAPEPNRPRIRGLEQLAKLRKKED